MNTGRKITELREATEVPGESRYPVSMGDGTGVKQVKHNTLVEQLKTDMGMTYDETMELLMAVDGEGNKKVPDVKAVSDWIASKITNNLLTTEAGFFLDARQGKLLNDKITQINSDLKYKPDKEITYTITIPDGQTSTIIEVPSYFATASSIKFFIRGEASSNNPESSRVLTMVPGYANRNASYIYIDDNHKGTVYLKWLTNTTIRFGFNGSGLNPSIERIIYK